MTVQILLLLIPVSALILTLRRLQQRSLTLWGAFVWSVLWVGAGTVIVHPRFASIVAELLGVGRGADVVVYFTVLFLLYLVFRIFLRIEKIERDITKIIQHIATQKDKKRNDDV